MNKKLFFLVATPRSGNTLFASIINQNPETDEEVKELELISRRKFAEECFGCYYED